MGIKAHAHRSHRLHLFTATVAVLIAFVLLLAHQFILARGVMQDEFHTEAAIISANSAAALVFDDPRAAGETLGALRQSPRVVGAALYRRDGALLSWYSLGEERFSGRLNVESPPAPWLRPLGGMLREDVRFKGEKVGTLELQLDFTPLFWHLLQYALGVAAIAVVSLLLTRRLTARMRRRMRRAEERLEQLALYDTVTGLPNRRLFEQEVRAAVSRAHRQSKAAALLFIDVDDFKKVNDSLGHEVGDRVLGMIAHRLRASTRASDVVARLGGDEFAAILYGIGGPDNAAYVARAMVAAIAEPFETEPPTHVGVSIGIAMLPDDGDDPALLLRRADMAMYSAKTHGKNGFEFFSTEIDILTHRHLELEAGMREILREATDELWVAYQPQVCADTGALLGVEALLRWTRPDGSSVSPAEFIPVAEKGRLISELGYWVLARVCADLAKLRAAGVDLPKVAVNVSPKQLLRGGTLVTNFIATLARYGETPDRIEIELTESAMMEEDGHLVIDALVDAGFQLAIDDFGTGYSSLGYLKRFRVGKLKIDQRFVRGLPEDAENAAIVGAVVQMTRALGIPVLAEGVETQAEAAFLRECGCNALQGYLLGRPMPVEQLAEFVRGLRLRSAPDDAAG